MAIGTTFWVALLGFATWNTTRLSPGIPASMTAAGVYVAGALVCHQRPERSFHYQGAQWPVCARCLGIYVGAALTAILATWWRRPSARSARRARHLLLGGALLNLGTLALEWGVGAPSNLWRGVAGAVLGATAAWAIATLAPAVESVEVH